jgi:hypothetical protein
MVNVFSGSMRLFLSVVLKFVYKKSIMGSMFSYPTQIHKRVLYISTGHNALISRDMPETYFELREWLNKEFGFFPNYLEFEDSVSSLNDYKIIVFDEHTYKGLVPNHSENGTVITHHVSVHVPEKYINRFIEETMKQKDD